MKIHDINKEKEKIIVLIHPMLFSCEGMKKYIVNYMGDDYRYIIPDLSAHGEESKATYESSKKEAEEMYNYLKLEGISNIDLGFGASLGGVVLFELMKYEDLNFEHLFFEGVSFYENSNIYSYVSKDIFLKKHKQAQKNPELSVRKLKNFYGEDAAEIMAKNFINMNDKSIVNMAYDNFHVKLPKLSEDIQKKCTFAYGKKDRDMKAAKKMCKKNYPKSEFRIWANYGHCEVITSKPKEYSDMLKTYIKKNQEIS